MLLSFITRKYSSYVQTFYLRTVFAMQKDLQVQKSVDESNGKAGSYIGLGGMTNGNCVHLYFIVKLRGICNR